MSHSWMSYDTNYHDITTPQELVAILHKSTGRTIIRFYRPGCPACDSSVGSWLELTRRPETRGHMFISIDITEGSALAKAMNVEYIPTYKALERGRPGTTVVGTDAEKLRRLIELGTV